MTDYISRADAIEAVKETKPIVRSTERNWGKMIAEQHSKELVKALKALPSASAVQGGRYENAMQKLREMPRYLNGVKAKQIKKISDDAVQGEWNSNQACSICGCQPWYEHDIHTLHYCPNCGARMKGGDSE